MPSARTIKREYGFPCFSSSAHIISSLQKTKILLPLGRIGKYMPVVKSPLSPAKNNFNKSEKTRLTPPGTFETRSVRIAAISNQACSTHSAPCPSSFKLQHTAYTWRVCLLLCNGEIPISSQYRFKFHGSSGVAARAAARCGM